MEKAALKVAGMSCEHCAKAVAMAIGGFAGVTDVSVDLKGGTAAFKFNPAETQLESIKAAIIEEGYTVTV